MPKIDVYVTNWAIYAFDETGEESFGVDVSEETLEKLRAGMRAFDQAQEILNRLSRIVRKKEKLL